MIAYIEGTLHATESGALIIMTAGVGYRVYISSETENMYTSSTPGSSVSLFTHLVVRENVLDLYGFHTSEERSLFELLIGVPGIGPKSALGILSLATVETLERSIRSGDTTYLTKVSGIGKKSAEKIVLELKDKIGGSGSDTDTLSGDVDVLEALRSLGYSTHEAREALKQLPQETTDTQDRIKEALKLLGSK